jgi:isoquinoline 1-oxidoreductase subunit beta
LYVAGVSGVPVFDISFVDSIEVPVGNGEPETTLVVQTVISAFFAVTGARVRHLLMTSHAALPAFKCK